MATKYPEVSGKFGKHLQLAFFSNATEPIFTIEVLRDRPNLGGTYTYIR